MELKATQSTRLLLIHHVFWLLMPTLYDASQSETSALGLKERRSGIEFLAIKENMKRNNIKLRWVNSGAMFADPMTKGKMRHMMERFLQNPVRKIVDDPELESFKKRTLKGQDALDYLYSLFRLEI